MSSLEDQVSLSATLFSNFANCGILFVSSTKFDVFVETGEGNPNYYLLLERTMRRVRDFCFFERIRSFRIVLYPKWIYAGGVNQIIRETFDVNSCA